MKIDLKTSLEIICWTIIIIFGMLYIEQSQGQYDFINGRMIIYSIVMFIFGGIYAYSEQIVKQVLKWRLKGVRKSGCKE